MNKRKLKQAEKHFLNKYATGFDHPDFIDLEKKHKMSKMIELAQTDFAKSKFSKHDQIVENMVKIVSRASMVSMFEKPKFRDFVASLMPEDKKKLSLALKNLLHNNQEKGFNAMLDVLRPAKLAKWSLMTIIPNYYHPDDEVFVKPTTAKGVIECFELKALSYKPAPSWEFYEQYRKTILQMKRAVDPCLKPNNAAFCGFLMMSMNKF